MWYAFYKFSCEEKTTINALKRNTFGLAFYIISAILRRNRSNTLLIFKQVFKSPCQIRSGKTKEK